MMKAGRFCRLQQTKSKVRGATRQMRGSPATPKNDHGCSGTYRAKFSFYRKSIKACSQACLSDDDERVQSDPTTDEQGRPQRLPLKRGLRISGRYCHEAEMLKV
jgi:hypothetical protein